MELVTRHARARMQQRGIRPEVLEALLDYGREVHAGGGCTSGRPPALRRVP